MCISETERWRSCLLPGVVSTQLPVPTEPSPGPSCVSGERRVLFSGPGCQLHPEGHCPHFPDGAVDAQGKGLANLPTGTGSGGGLDWALACPTPSLSPPTGPLRPWHRGGRLTERLL